jgi:tripartite-type tricarboxylate transporter receptor subunit TctC
MFATGGLLLPWRSDRGATRAQDYRAEAMRIVVPFQAGGSTDMVARTLAQKLKERFDQPVVVENAPARTARSGAARWRGSRLRTGTDAAVHRASCRTPS